MSAIVDPTIIKALLVVWLRDVVQQQTLEPSPPQFSWKKWSKASGESKVQLMVLKYLEIFQGRTS